MKRNSLHGSVIFMVLAICLSAPCSKSDEIKAGVNSQNMENTKTTPRRRSPQWLPKTSRTLHSDEEIGRARKACLNNADAKKIKDKVLEDAD
jgi:hypothetical protein